MKKLFIALFVLTLGFFLSACGNDVLYEKVFSETLIVYGFEDNSSSVTSDLTLTVSSELVEEASLVWESKNTAVITIDGDKGLVTRSTSDVEVTLVLKVTIKKTTKEKEFKVTVKALAADQVTVSFNANGGTGAPSAVVVAKNSKITQPTQVPTRQGYAFIGWYKDQAGTTAFNFATETVSANLVLYAKWQETVAEELTYKFDFADTNLGNSYSSNTNATKNIKNIQDGSNFQVIVTRVAANNNHDTYKDPFLVMSASSKKTDTDLAWIEFSFSHQISKIEFDAVFWSSFDADQVTKLVLQVKNGDTWTDVYDIKQVLNKTLEYKKVTISNLTGSHYRIYGEGVDPTGGGDNGARILFDNFKVYSAVAVDLNLWGLNQDIENLSITTRYRKAGGILLPEFGNNGSSITWSFKNSSDANNVYLSLENLSVSLPNEGVVNIILVASLTNGSYSRTKEFTIIIGEGGTYSDYYQTINGLTGAALKAELNRIISQMTNVSEKTTNSVLAESDADPNHPGNVLLVYNRASVSGTWDGGNTWNKEHVWPDSKMGNAYKYDVHNLRAANPGINSSRGNNPFADGSGTYGSKSGGWFPGDNDKGDIARIVFYMNTRWNLTINGEIGSLQVFLKWHNEDPVDDFEIRRNEVISQRQGNRNPYIDHPELVAEVYGTYQAQQSNVRRQPEIIIYLDLEYERRKQMAA